MKRITPLLAILCVASIVGASWAEPPGRRGKQGQNANGQKGQRGKQTADGQRRAGQGQRPGPGADRDPAEIVARMMKEFDKDGDKKLNVTELTAMLTSMRERRGGQRPEAASGRKPGAAAGRKPGGNDGKSRRGAGKDDGQKQGAANRQRRRGGDESATPGGERPKRPEGE